ncbi:hypothetical protein [uncultured Tateyamaria sp.]|nr:hypothetical protein [uncultured Tateyamaria sp.]
MAPSNRFFGKTSLAAKFTDADLAAADFAEAVLQAAAVMGTIQGTPV